MDECGETKADIILMPAAISDLQEIEDYVASNSGEHAAEAVSDAILARCNSLAAMPYSGTRRDEIEHGVRSITAMKRYVIYYKPEPGPIAVLRIRHGSRDAEKFFRS